MTSSDHICDGLVSRSRGSLACLPSEECAARDRDDDLIMQMVYFDGHAFHVDRQLPCHVYTASIVCG